MGAAFDIANKTIPSAVVDVQNSCGEYYLYRQEPAYATEIGLFNVTATGETFSNNFPIFPQPLTSDYAVNSDETGTYNVSFASLRSPRFLRKQRFVHDYRTN